MLTLPEMKEYIKKNKIKYSYIAEKSGLPEGTIKNIFADPYKKNPRIDTMQAIEKALGLNQEPDLAQSIINQVDSLNITDYNNLSKEEKEKVAVIFNTTVDALKKKGD